MAQPVAVTGEGSPGQLISLALATNAALAGETTNTGKFTAGAGNKTIKDSRCRAGRFAILIPLDSIASEQRWYLSKMTKGEMTFTITGSGTGSWAWEIIGV